MKNNKNLMMCLGKERIMSTMRTIKRKMLRNSSLPKRMVKKIANESRLYIAVEKPRGRKKRVKVKSGRRKMGVRYGNRSRCSQKKTA